MSDLSVEAGEMVTKYAALADSLSQLAAAASTTPTKDKLIDDIIKYGLACARGPRHDATRIRRFAAVLASLETFERDTAKRVTS